MANLARLDVDAAALPVLHGARVLLVEDDAILLMELETILQDAGAQIVGACRSVADALVAVEQGRPTAAVLDVRIGRETIAPVARQLGRSGTPFVFYTGQIPGDPELTEWSSCRIVSKPARAATIVAAVAELLHKAKRLDRPD
jgi:DNA-binding response OmpR family regulator